MLYTFLVRHAVIDITQSREDPARQKLAENFYVALSVTVYVALYLLERR